MKEKTEAYVMAGNKKEPECNELHKTIWSRAHDLRGSVDDRNFKSYVLGTIFYKFISENPTNYIKESESDSGRKNFGYAEISEIREIVAREQVLRDEIDKIIVEIEGRQSA